SPDSWSGAPPAPIEAKAALASALLRQALSGGNSTMRRIVPSAGGSSLIRPVAASALPAFEAGELLVRHRSVSATPGIDAISRTLGALPSMTKIDWPSLSWPVTTRRMRCGMRFLLLSSPTVARYFRRPKEPEDGSDIRHGRARVPAGSARLAEGQPDARDHGRDQGR